MIQKPTFRLQSEFAYRSSLQAELALPKESNKLCFEPLIQIAYHDLSSNPTLRGIDEKAGRCQGEWLFSLKEP